MTQGLVRGGYDRGTRHDAAARKSDVPIEVARPTSSSTFVARPDKLLTMFGSMVDHPTVVLDTRDSIVHGGIVPRLADGMHSRSRNAQAVNPHDRDRGSSPMGVMVLLEAPVKSEDVPKMKSYLAEILPGTRSYDGCKGINAYFDTEAADKLVLLQHWDSRAHHEKYLGWRTETGVMAKLGGMLAGPPSIRYLEESKA